MAKRTQSWKKRISIFKRNKVAIGGALIILIVTVIAIFAHQLAPRDPLAQDVFYRLTAPETKFPFGTDFMGRDIFSRVIIGARTSLLVGTSAVLIALVVGVVLGMFAGYIGGKAETMLMRTLDVWMSFPDEVLGVLGAVMFGTGVLNLIIILGLLLTPRFSRLAYNYTTVIREEEYILSARGVGAGWWRVLINHIFPNIRGDVITMGALWLGTAIRLEANLSFLGVGIPPPTPTWGNMIREGMRHIGNAPWIAMFPGAVLMLTIFGFNLLADGLRDISDPKLME